MADDPTMPTSSGFPGKGRARAAFDKAPPVKEPDSNDKKPPSKPFPALEMKGPDGTAIRKDVRAQSDISARVQKVAETRKDDAMDILKAFNSRSATKDLAKSKDDDERSR